LLLSLFLVFFKIGLFTFGGGYAMISQIRETVVEKKKWADDNEVSDIIAVAESTPGPIAINLATYIGYKKAGFLGSLCATLGVVIPAFTVMIIIALFSDKIMTNKYVVYAFNGIKCAVAFLILKAGIEMALKLEKKKLVIAFFIAVLAALIILDLLSVSFSSLVFIIAGGVLGIIISAVIWSKGDKKE